MPDLTTVAMSMCKSIDGPKSYDVRGYEQHGLFSEQSLPFCSCPAYKFSLDYPKSCKHLRQIAEDECGWHQQYCKEIQETDHVCPRCGGETISVLVAV